MKKLLILSLALLLLLCALVGCGGQKSAQFDPQEAADALLAAEAFSDILSPIQPAIAAMLYKIPPESIDACSVYCSTGATAEEIAVFRCVDEASAAALKQAAQQRLQEQKAAYESYAPLEIPKLDNALLRASGVYVVCVVAEDYDAVRPILDKFIK